MKTRRADSMGKLDEERDAERISSKEMEDGNWKAVSGSRDAAGGGWIRQYEKDGRETSKSRTDG
jgi:hypothetical protein